MQPEDLRYTEAHAWVRSDNNLAIVGITDHAQSELGDIVYVELPEVGASVHVGDVIGTIESVKTVTDITAPVSGKVVRVNSELPEMPERMNESPYDAGWMVWIEMDDVLELNGLMSAEQYEQFIQER